MSDFWPHGEIAEKYGVLRSDGSSERAIFIIDKNGIIQYIDIHDIDDQPDNEVLFAELKRMDPDAFAELAENLPKEAASASKSAIVMYCNRWCPDCRKARQWFAEHEIEYEDIDVVINKDAAERARSLARGKLVTPTFDINGTIILDWNERRIAELVLK